MRLSWSREPPDGSRWYFSKWTETLGAHNCTHLETHDFNQFLTGLTSCRQSFPRSNEKVVYSTKPFPMRPRSVPLLSYMKRITNGPTSSNSTRTHSMRKFMERLNDMVVDALRSHKPWKASWTQSQVNKWPLPQGLTNLGKHPEWSLR